MIYHIFQFLQMKRINLKSIYRKHLKLALIISLELLECHKLKFVEYVLRNYIDIGEDELDVSKLSTVIRAKYGSISAAQEKLGTAQDIKKTFINFQQYLYQEIRT